MEEGCDVCCDGKWMAEKPNCKFWKRYVSYGPFIIETIEDR
jgi:hypothetical protein